MRTIIHLVLVTVVLMGMGCQDSAKKTAAPVRRGAHLFVVDFDPARPLRYKFVSERQVDVRFGTGRKSSEKKYNETMELIIAYSPVESDPFGYSIIEGKCESATVKRNSSGNRKGVKDAVEHLKGKSFTLKIGPTGEIVDYSSLGELIAEIGERAFDSSSKRKGRVKNPDMIMDFIAMQWFLWDTTSSISEPLQGVVAGQSWESKLLVPMPVPVQVGREVVYSLDEVKEIDGSKVAVIKSSYKVSDAPPEGLAMPYTGRFQMRGTFGFLQGYDVVSLEGDGTQLFNLDTGLIESDTQQYTAKVKAALMFGLGGEDPEPNLNVKQRLEIQKLE